MSIKTYMRGGLNTNYVAGLRELARDCLGPASVMVEIGVYAGESTRIFLESGRVQHLWAIDPWRDHYDPSDPFSEKYPMAEVRQAFFENIEEFQQGAVPKVTVFVAESLYIAWLAPDHFFNLVYIDAKHQFEDVRGDIVHWLPKVKPGGFIAGHDYNDAWPSVKKAVDTILGKPTRVYADDSWVVWL